MTEKKPPVYILIRTSGRPKFFSVMMDSIKKQTYENIITITHSDDPNDDYVQGDIILNGEKPTGPDIGRAPYNLYCNRLLDAIPEDAAEGWFHFMDDDDMYYDDRAIENFVNMSNIDAVNVARSDRGGGKIWPRYWRGQKSFQTQCFLINVKYRKSATWWSKTAGDHHYSKQLTAFLPINWIDNLIVAKAQEGKGRGHRYDLGEAPKDTQKKSTKKELVPVYFLKKNKKPRAAQAEQYDIRLMTEKLAYRLQQRGIGKILDKTKYDDFVNNVMK